MKKRNYFKIWTSLLLTLLLSCPFQVSALERGDVDLNGAVNINDVATLIDMLLSGDFEYFAAADVDNNGTINIADVSTLIDWLLEGHHEYIDEDENTFTVNGVSFKMVPVEGGTFEMGGTAYGDEGPTHAVTLSSYRIGQTEVTQALWLAVMGENPSSDTAETQQPVEMVSWNDCQTFIAALNEATGETFRLPTEAEWEYAARGELIEHLTNDVNEWCNDWYGPYWSTAVTDPAGPASGTRRVVRGSALRNYEYYYSTSLRLVGKPDHRSNHLGLRLAL